MLSTIAYLEGDSASALRCDMLCHRYAKDIKLVEQSIEHTFNLLLHYNKIEDCAVLINQSLDMLSSLYEKHENANKLGKSNLPLEYTLGTVFILKAILSIKES